MGDAFRRQLRSDAIPSIYFPSQQNGRFSIRSNLTSASLLGLAGWYRILLHNALPTPSSAQDEGDVQYQEIFFKRTKQLVVKKPYTTFGRALSSWPFTADRTSPSPLHKESPLPQCTMPNTIASVPKPDKGLWLHLHRQPNSDIFSLMGLLINQISSEKDLL